MYHKIGIFCNQGYPYVLHRVYYFPKVNKSLFMLFFAMYLVKSS